MTAVIGVHAPETRVWPPDRGTGCPVADTPPGTPRPAPNLSVEVLAISALGVLLVALAYAGGRWGSGWAPAVYWVGQVVVFAPVAVRLLAARAIGRSESATLVLGLAVAQYAQKWMYSPDMLRFPDELQHWAGTALLVDTGRLFGHNAALPVANHFPGLEEAGAAVVSLTGLPVGVAGIVVAGVAHLIFVGALFLIAGTAGARPRSAGLVCVLYATGMHYLFFDSMYIYQTIALPFLALAVWAARTWRLRDARTLPYGLLGLAAIAVVVVSHHITTFVLVGTLGTVAAVDLVRARSPHRYAAAVLAGAAVVAGGAWLAFPARDVWGYLDAPARDAAGALTRFVTGGESGGTGASPGLSGPRWELGIQVVALLVLLVLLGAEVVDARRRGHRDPWRTLLLAGGVAFFGSMGLRFVGAAGPELAGRAATFTYLPMAVVAARVLLDWHADPPGPGSVVRPGRRLALGTAAALLLMISARAGGWPPAWERLPGGYAPGGFESSVDAEGIAAAEWLRGSLGPGYHRVLADLSSAALISSYGGQDAVANGSRLYYDTTWGLADDRLCQQLGISHAWVDRRLGERPSVSGKYFLDGSTVNGTAVPVAGLDKFDGLTGVERVYDSGDIRVYDMGEQW